MKAFLPIDFALELQFLGTHEILGCYRAYLVGKSL